MSAEEREIAEASQEWQTWRIDSDAEFMGGEIEERLMVGKHDLSGWLQPEDRKYDVMNSSGHVILGASIEIERCCGYLREADEYIHYIRPVAKTSEGWTVILEQRDLLRKVTV